MQAVCRPLQRLSAWRYAALPIQRCCYSMQHDSSKQPSRDTTKPHVIFKCPTIVPLRILQRLKFVHLVAMTAVAGGHTVGMIAQPVALTAGVVLCTSGALLLVTSPWIQRYIGLISTDASRSTLTVSCLSFWGRRVNYSYPLQTLRAPFKTLSQRRIDEHLKRHMFTKLTFQNGDYYFLNHKVGKIHDKAMYDQIMGMNLQKET